jgi:hypothetical protein
MRQRDRKYLEEEKMMHMEAATERDKEKTLILKNKYLIT